MQPSSRLLELDQLDLPEPDLGIITSGLCSTPEAQDAFDAEQAGKPPLDEKTA
jgi:hypothetical protein